MYPLEQRIPDIIAKAAQSYYPSRTALNLIKQQPGMLPILFLPEANYRVAWLDVGQHPFTEWKFRYAVEAAVQRQSNPQAITTDKCILTYDEVLTDTIYPSGFVFQMSLCGSTLLAKALARLPQHLVLNEGTPLHEPLWQYLTHNWQQPVMMTDKNNTLIRNLILALGRRRLPEQAHYFVKFRSWNVLFFEAIMRAFPDVPCLFLYRDPAEVVVSALKKEPTGYTRFKGTPAAAFMLGCPTEVTAEMGYLDYFVRLYEQYFLSILKAPYKHSVYLNYDQLKRENFAYILERAFSYLPPPKQLLSMQAQFDYYSKDDSGTKRFVSDEVERQNAVTPEIRTAVDRHLVDLYQQLEQSDKNLNQWLVRSAGTHPERILV